MRRYRRGPVEEDNVNRWLVSYADYMTLLFALFVVLYAMAIVNEKPFETVTESLGRVFQADKDKPKNRGHGEDILPVKQSKTSKRLFGNGIIEEKGPELTEGEVTLSNVSDTEVGENLSTLEDELHAALYELIESGLAQLTVDGDWLEIKLSSGLLFPSGSSSATNSARVILTNIYDVIGKVNNYIRIRGYTDNQPIQTEVFSSNWELSVIRATSILRALEQLSINPARMAIEGYGQYHPVGDNNTEAGRAQNRRVVIAISKFGLSEQSVNKIRPIERKEIIALEDIKPTVQEGEVKVIQLETGGIRITTREDKPAQSNN